MRMVTIGSGSRESESTTMPLTLMAANELKHAMSMNTRERMIDFFILSIIIIICNEFGLTIGLFRLLSPMIFTAK